MGHRFLQICAKKYYKSVLSVFICVRKGGVMKRICCCAIVLLTLLSWGLALATDGEYAAIRNIEELTHQSGKIGAYRALIIGINDYQDPKIPDLDTAVNDARGIGAVLSERYGFKVKYLVERKATKEAIYRELRKLVATAKTNDSILIYYAGHGDIDHIYNDGW